jgi:6-phosphogluconolactonase
VSVELVVTEDWADAAAGLLAATAGAGGHLALSGGSAPGPALERAAKLRPDWSGATVWWGDDRAVPPDHELSNHRLAQERLLARLEGRPAVHRIRGELGAREAADAYDAELAGVTLDLALQGIGPDGHTASLFPHSPALEETERRAVAVEAGMEPFVPRVTMTVPMLNASRLVLFLVVGAEKAEAAERAFALPPSPATPASLVRSAGGRTVAILDPAAASRLGG